MPIPIFLQGPKGSFIIFDYIISVLAIFGNSLILESVLKVQFDLTGYRRFLISLAVSDLYICFVNIMTFIHSAVIMYSPDPELQKCGSDILRSMQFCGFFANLLNLCGMSVDHFIGIVYPLRYCDFMSPRIARMAVVSIWVVSLVIGFADYPISLGMYLARSSRSNDNSEAGDSRLVTPYPDFPSTINNGDQFNNNSTSTPAYDLLRYGDMSSSSAYDDPLIINASSYHLPVGAGAGPFGHDGLDIMSDDIDVILSSIVGGSFPAAKFGISVNSSTKDRLKNILSLVVQPKKDEPGWCTILHPTRGWLEFSVMTMTLICFVFLSICYGRIFKEVFGNVDQTERNTRKLVITTFLLLGAFTICWMPFMVFEFIMIITFYANSSAPSKAMTSSASLFIVHNAFNSMLICAPLIDPLIYSARMRIIRRYLLMRYKRLFPCCRSYVDKALAPRTTYNYSAPTLGRTSLALTSQQRNSVNRQYVEVNGGRGKEENHTETQLHSKPRTDLNGDGKEATEPLIVANKPPLNNSYTSANPSSNNSPIITTTPAIYTSGNRFKRQMREQQVRSSLAPDRQTSKLAARRHSSREQGEMLSLTTSHQVTASHSGVIMPKVNNGNTLITLPQSATLLQGYATNNGDLKHEMEGRQMTSTSVDNFKTVLSETRAGTENDAISRCTLATPEHSTSTPNSTPAKPTVAPYERTCADDSAFIPMETSLLETPVKPAVMKPIDFADSEAVYRKFRGNAMRLLDLSDDDNNAIMLARLARGGHPTRSEKLPRKVYNRLLQFGKSPTLGDLSTPSEDLLIVTTDC